MNHIICIVTIAFVIGHGQSQDTTEATVTEALALANPTVSDACLALSNQGNCESCITAHPECTWCSDNITTLGMQQIRCRKLSSNQAQCSPGHVLNPQNSLSINKNEEFSNVSKGSNIANLSLIQLKPQEVTLNLRKGLSQAVNFTFRRVADYPLDLYYVMDLSFSMEDDLNILKKLGSSLVDEIRNFTTNLRLGFGTFVDKVMLPYASTVPEHLKDPCYNLVNETCAPVFGFRHQVSVTADGDAFIEAVQATNISGNIDSPEGGFDALMQIAVCQDKIKWRPEALRVILFTTDASSHVAMDGKLASLLEINDMRCHLDTGVNAELPPDAILYSASRIMDYPSIGQLKKVFYDNKIQTVFAVTDDVKHVYKDLENLLDNAFVSTLNRDSSNIVKVISTSYEALRTKVSLTPPTVPDNINLVYRVLCPNSTKWKENSLECSNADIDTETIFQFEFTAVDCPNTPSTIDTVDIVSSSIRDTIKLNIGYKCECDCRASRIQNSSKCGYSGSLECGVCVCNEGFRGSKCQCRRSTTGIPLEQNCTESFYVSGVSLCNLNGYCECGKCICQGEYYGKYCECRPSGCPDNLDGPCGGPEKGKCVNCKNSPTCVCNTTAGWYLDPETGLCTCNNELCKCKNSECTTNASSNTLCDGKGTCKCSACSCNTNYEGSYCQRCVHPLCTGIDGTCSGIKPLACAECAYENDRLNKQVSEECFSVCEGQNIQVNIDDTLPDCNSCLNGIQSTVCDTCNTLSTDPSVHIAVDCETNPFSNCILKYKIAWDKIRKSFVVFVRRFTPDDCPKINPLLIILPVVGGILLGGIIALIVWKILQTLRDKREYEKFEAERAQAKWAVRENETYVKPKDRVENPLFVK